jgi:hypothetical protein
MSKELARPSEGSAENPAIRSTARPAEIVSNDRLLRFPASDEIGEGGGFGRLVEAFHNRLEGATPEDAFKATDILLGKMAEDVDQGWMPGAVKQHGSGWRFRARDVKIQDSESQSEADQ